MPFDRRHAAVAAAGFCSFLDLYPTQSLLPALASEFHAGKAALGWTVSATTLGVAVMAPLAGWLAERLGRKRVIVAGALLMALPTALAAHAGSVAELVLWRFLQGVFLPAVFAVTSAHVNEEWPPAEAPDLIGIQMAGMVAGGFAGRTLAAIVADLAGWRWAFPLLAGLNLAGAAALAAWLPADSRPPRRRSGRDGRLLPALLAPRLVATCAVGAAILFSMVATFTYVGFLLAAPPFSLGIGALGGIFVVYLVGLPAAIATGPLLRRFGRRRLMSMATAVTLAGLALTLSGVLPAVLAGLALVASGVFMAGPLAIGFAGLAVPQARAVAVGLYVCCYYVGGSLGGVAPSAVWPSFGWPGVVAVIALVQVLALAFAALAWGGRRSDPYFSMPRSAPVRSLMAWTRPALATSQASKSLITSGCESLDSE
jgi:predicted MFS family arabinose efflux permease